MLQDLFSEFTFSIDFLNQLTCEIVILIKCMKQAVRNMQVHEHKFVSMSCCVLFTYIFNKSHTQKYLNVYN